MIDIETKQATQHRVTIDITAKYQCDNCNEIVLHTEAMKAEDIADLIVGWYLPDIDCPHCEDKLIPCGFLPETVLDLTCHQIDMTAATAHMLNYITPVRYIKGA